MTDHGLLASVVIGLPAPVDVMGCQGCGGRLFYPDRESMPSSNNIGSIEKVR